MQVQLFRLVLPLIPHGLALLWRKADFYALDQRLGLVSGPRGPLVNPLYLRGENFLARIASREPRSHALGAVDVRDVIARAGRRHAGWMTTRSGRKPTPAVLRKRPAAQRLGRQLGLFCAAAKIVAVKSLTQLEDRWRYVFLRDRRWQNKATGESSDISMHDDERRRVSSADALPPSQLAPDPPVERPRPAAAQRDGERHQAPQQHVFVAAVGPREAVAPVLVKCE